MNNSTLKATKLGGSKFLIIRMVLVQHYKVILLESQFGETVFFLIKINNYDDSLLRKMSDLRIVN